MKKSVRFTNASQPLSIARIDEVLNKGDLSDFIEFLEILISAPNGEVAKKMDELFSKVNIDDPDFHSKEQFLAAHHLLSAIRQYNPH